MSESLPHWILENVIAVEDTYLTPKPRLQVIGQTTELIILPKVLEKWDGFSQRHKLTNSINYYLQKLEPEQLTNIQRWAFASVLDIKPDSYVEIGMTWATSNMSIFFIFADTQLIEFVTFRGMRQIRKKAAHIADRAKGLAGMPEVQRIHKISKFPRQLKIQGGLIRQERQPRDRWKGCQKTF